MRTIIKYKSLMAALRKAAIAGVAVVLAVGLLRAPAEGAGALTPDGFSGFIYSGDFSLGQFTDAGQGGQVEQYIVDACNYGLMNGKSDTLFEPDGIITLGEAVAIAAAVRSTYYADGFDFAGSGAAGLADCLQYARAHGITDGFDDYGSPATRAQFVGLLFGALPPEAFAAINIIPEYGICDVVPDDPYGKPIYAFCRAGILSGSDRFGTFFPDAPVSRGDASAFLVLLVDPVFRLRASQPSAIPAEIIFRRCADAVFMLETYDEDGEIIRTGSAFFISEMGLAVTNLHVFDNAADATAILHDGERCPVKGFNAYSEENNLAVFSVDSKNPRLSCLKLADSGLIEEGNTVYTIGSPRELINTMTDGIVSKKLSEASGAALIQFTAPISFGSGGSPLLNTLGQVVGIASSSYSYGQNLNLAVPVNFLKEIEIGQTAPLSVLLRRFAG